MKNNAELGMKVNWILLGLVMLVPGVLKLFGGAGGPASMLENIPLFAWAPMFWAWILILGEIGSGIAILAKYKVEQVVWIPVIILLVATLFIHWGSWPSVLIHLAVISNYLMYTKGGCCTVPKASAKKK